MNDTIMQIRQNKNTALASDALVSRPIGYKYLRTELVVPSSIRKPRMLSTRAVDNSFLQPVGGLEPPGREMTSSVPHHTTGLPVVYHDFFAQVVCKATTGQANPSTIRRRKYGAGSVRTKEFCVGDGTSETCITKAQLDSLLAGTAAGTTTTAPTSSGPGNSGSNGGGSGGGTGGGGAPAPAPAPTDTGSSTPPSDPNLETGTPSVDTEAPVVTLIGSDPTEVAVGTLYIDSGVSVSDNIDQGLPYVISLDGGAPVDPATLSLDTSLPTTYTLVYSATDTAGNIGTATRTVYVVEPVPLPAPAPEPAPEPTPEPAPAPDPEPTPEPASEI